MANGSQLGGLEHIRVRRASRLPSYFQNFLQTPPLFHSVCPFNLLSYPLHTQYGEEKFWPCYFLHLWSSTSNLRLSKMNIFTLFTKLCQKNFKLFNGGERSQGRTLNFPRSVRQTETESAWAVWRAPQNTPCPSTMNQPVTTGLLLLHSPTSSTPTPTPTPPSQPPVR